MATDITVPTLGESVSEASVIQWFKKVGDSVAKDEPLVELETDKVTIEVPSPVAGAMAEIIADSGADVEVGALLCRIDEGATGSDSKKEEAPKAEAAPEPAKEEKKPEPEAKKPAAAASNETLSPAVAKMVAENDLDASKIPAS